MVVEHPRIQLVNSEVKDLPGGHTLVCSGPLTSDDLLKTLQPLLGTSSLFFYDAIAPIVTGDSINREKTFMASRYAKGDPDFLNCPMNREEYDLFYKNLVSAKMTPLEKHEKNLFFEACLPVEEIARRGPATLTFGPLRPVGLNHPETNRRYHAVLQLLRQDRDGKLWGMVGCQTRMVQSEQRRVFRLIPGLEQAEFAQYGAMHRNSYINSPQNLDSHLECKKRRGLFFAGQITGSEGYTEAIATGLVAGINGARNVLGLPSWLPPGDTAMGSLCRWITDRNIQDFKPMNFNFGLLPELKHRISNKQEKRKALSERALSSMQKFLKDNPRVLSQ
jgi:methylenetetrahydrofolate--tRNA-(uracil-5-)-methyltransferase